MRSGTLVGITLKAVRTGTVTFLVTDPISGAGLQRVSQSITITISQLGVLSFAVNIPTNANARVAFVYVGGGSVPIAYEASVGGSFTAWNENWGGSLPSIGQQVSLITGQQARFAVAYCYVSGSTPPVTSLTTTAPSAGFSGKFL